jgi:diadenylate cyclase
VSDLFFILSRLNFNSLVDILLVALVFYWLLTLIQGTQAVQLLRGMLILSVLAAIAAGAFSTLTAFSWLIDKALPALLVAVPVIFQPELRRALDRVGRTGKFLAGSGQTWPADRAIETVSKAAVFMAQVRHGALIVFERNTGLEDHIETGIRLDALVSPDLLASLFYPGTSLHDGSVIIRGDRIVAAAVLLPLEKESAGQDYPLGTRHRAGLSITAMTDAIAVIVSEETGIISVAHNGRLIRGLDQKRLVQILKAFFKPHLTTAPRWQQWVQKFFRQAKPDQPTKPHNPSPP